MTRGVTAGVIGQGPGVDIPLHLTVTGDADADLAWERYARPDLWPSWSPQIRSVETKGERIRSGLTGDVRGPAGVRASFRVISVDEESRCWSWRVRLGPVALTLDHAVVPTPDGRTRTTLVVRAAPWALPVAAAYLPVAALALRRLVSRK